MARFLMAWELGANLGHLTRLRPVVSALQARGHHVDLALRDVTRARTVLGPAPGRLYQAPLALNGEPGVAGRPAWTLADVLQSCGYASAGGLSGLVEAWRAVFDASGCQALVVDHAPTALLAARAAGLPAVHIGHGFSVPPRVSPLPVFRDWASPPASHAAEVDAAVLGVVNTVLREHGAKPLHRLCDLFYPEHTVLCTWPELDHYGGRGRAPTDCLGPDGEYLPGAPAEWPPGTGAYVFAYLRQSHPGHTALLRALAGLGLPTLCYLQGDAEPEVTAHTLRYSRAPVDLRRVLPRCSLLVCHGGQATVAQALRLGVPALMLPEHAEQHLLARQLERHGAGVNLASQPPGLNTATLIAQMVRPDGAHAQAANALAQRHADFRPEALTSHIADAALSLIG